MQKTRVVVVGGGTGTHTLLRGLRRYNTQLDLTAIVTMADSGGSTGRLRDEFGQLPVGDVRMALTALAASIDDHDELLRELFLYRFNRGAGLSGHNFGNLLLTALTDILGTEERAIEAAGRILRIEGTVIPVTTDNVHLVAEYTDGSVRTGEHIIDDESTLSPDARITSLSLSPSATLNPRAATALLEADHIIFGPGDLYTSIIANVVVDGFSEVVAQSSASLTYVSNLMSKIGQTVGMNAHDHFAELTRYLKRTPDRMVVNSTPLEPSLVARYAQEGNHPITYTPASHVIAADVVATELAATVSGDVMKRSLVRHDRDKLAQTLVALMAPSET